jgi:hypothetical protein
MLRNYEDMAVSNPNLDKERVTTFRPHTHCPTCWREDYVLRHDGVKVCAHCEATPVIVCTPIVCASS